MTRCASCGKHLTEGEMTFLDGRFCELCEVEQKQPFDVLKDTFASIILAMKIVRDRGQE